MTEQPKKILKVTGEYFTAPVGTKLPYNQGGIVSGGAYSSHVHLNFFKKHTNSGIKAQPIPWHKPGKLTHLQNLRDKLTPSYSHHLVLTRCSTLSGLSATPHLEVTHPDGTQEFPSLYGFSWKRWEDLSTLDTARVHAEFYTAPNELFLEVTGVILLESTQHTSTLSKVEMFGNECLCANSESLFG